MSQQAVGVAYTWVRVDFISELVRCERCAKVEYMRSSFAESVTDTLERFLQVHKTCRPSGQIFDTDRADLR